MRDFNKRDFKRFVTLLGLFTLVWTAALPAQDAKKKKKEDASTRELRGVVNLPDGSVAPTAIVQLRDAATQQIRSYIAKDDGTYRFAGLKNDSTYQVRAELRDMETNWKTLSPYDSRPDPTINLKLEPSKASPKADPKSAPAK
jgi:Carboxypeptidase regulatory-like domain